MRPECDSKSPMHAGQTVSIEVLGEPEFSRVGTVDVDGAIDYPLLGRIPVAGRQRREVKTEIEVRLGKYLREPRVVVNVSECTLRLDPAPRSLHSIRVLGTVGSPGVLRYDSGLRTSSAIALSGWFTAGAERREVWVLRPRVGHRRAVLAVCDFQQLLGYGDTAQDLLLGPSDIVYVPSHSAESPESRAECRAAARYLTGQIALSDLLAALGASNRSPKPTCVPRSGRSGFAAAGSA